MKYPLPSGKFARKHFGKQDFVVGISSEVFDKTMSFHKNTKTQEYHSFTQNDYSRKLYLNYGLISFPRKD